MAAPKKAAAKGSKERKKGADSLYHITGSRFERNSRFCPKCGQGFFMADHQNRRTCGKCGYTEFKK